MGEWLGCSVSAGISFAYDSADRLTQITYPDGEVVTVSYDDAMRPRSLSSASVYVSNATYKALGLLTRMDHGNGARTQRYHYGSDLEYPNASNISHGRLRRLCVATSSGNCDDDSSAAGALLKLVYAYDAVGNIRFSGDRTTGERLAYSYDDLDRLTGVAPQVGWPGYTESYSYDAIGRMISHSALGTFNYWHPSKPQAVTHLNNAPIASYDANGNMLSRTELGVVYQHVWDAENRLTRVTSASSGYGGLDTQFFYDADGQLVKKVAQRADKPFVFDGFENANSTLWSLGNNLTFGYNDGGRLVLRMVGTGVDWSARIDRTGGDISHGRSVVVDFKVANDNTGLHLTLETASGDYWRWSLNHLGTALYNCYANPSGWQPCTVLLPHLQTHTWYRARLTIDDVNGAKVEVWQRDTGMGYASRTQAMPTGRTWYFFHTLYTGTAYVDNYAQQMVGGAQTTVYIGPQVEWNTSTNTWTNYYVFPSTALGAGAGQHRVAMRTCAGTCSGSNPGTVYWLHTDHLGSASLATNASGGAVGQARYLPYGEKRVEWNLHFSDRKFTGQREQPELGGLYHYHARFYSPRLSRFISPDSIVPEPGNPQALNRYAYVYNNPLKYTDPSGHWVETAWDLFSIGLTLNDIREEGLTWQNGLALVVDVGTALLPGVPAFAGVLMKGGKAAKAAVEAASRADEVVDAAKAGAKVAEGLAEEAAKQEGKEAAEETAQRLIRHHIATNKNWIRDPQWSRDFQRLFAKGGMTLEDAVNIVELPAELHKGPHSQAYHQWVYRELQRATTGLKDPDQIRAALEARLRWIAEQLKAHPEYLQNPPIGGRR